MCLNVQEESIVIFKIRVELNRKQATLVALPLLDEDVAVDVHPKERFFTGL